MPGDGEHPLQECTSAVADMPVPTDTTEIHHFLGASQLGNFCKELAEVSPLLRRLFKNDHSWVWGTAQEEAFQKIKTFLCSTTHILQWLDNGELGPVTYYSHTLTPTEERYAQIELNWIGLDLFNNDTHPLGHISHPIWDVSHSCFQSPNKLIKPYHIVQVRGVIDFQKLHHFRDD